MKLAKVALLAVALGVSAVTCERADAAPVFGLPDWNYVTHNASLTFAGPLSDPTGFRLSVDPARGDNLSIDTGTGFRSGTNTLVVSVFEGEGQLFFRNAAGADLFTGTLLSVSIRDSLVGKDILAFFRLTSSHVPFATTQVGAILGFDALVYNITTVNGVTTAKAKGDFAPVVPEPATLLLVLGSLGALAGRVRRARQV